jgi:hypothetical protein
MKKLFLCIFFFFLSCEETTKQQVSVDTFQCESSDLIITPQMVEKSPQKYTGKCFTWIGRISQVSESDPGYVFILDDMFGEFDDNIQYTSKSSFGLSLTKDGKFTNEKYNYYTDVHFNFDEKWYYDNSTDEIFNDDIVKVEGTVLGEKMMPNPLFEDRFMYSTAFVVYSLEKIGELNY